jgi:hypothetical protein
MWNNNNNNNNNDNNNNNGVLLRDFRKQTEFLIQRIFNSLGR